MVRIYRSEHAYAEPPQTPLLAYFVRYPNPFARHVLSVDVVDRWIDAETGQLHTKRLILKRGIIPKWASKWLPASNMSGGRGLDAWILEESVVDPPGWGGNDIGSSGLHDGGENAAESSATAARRAMGQAATPPPPRSQAYGVQPRLKFTQGNLNHRKFMHVIESGELCAGDHDTTIHRTQAEIKSDFGGAWSAMIRQRIESYGAGKFETNSEHSRKGMSLVMTRLRSRQPLADTAEFYPPPPPQFSDAWPAPLGGRAAARSPLEREQWTDWLRTRWRA